MVGWWDDELEVIKVKLEGQPVGLAFLCASTGPSINSIGSVLRQVLRYNSGTTQGPYWDVLRQAQQPCGKVVGGGWWGYKM